MVKWWLIPIAGAVGIALGFLITDKAWKDIIRGAYCSAMAGDDTLDRIIRRLVHFDD